MKRSSRAGWLFFSGTQKRDPPLRPFNFALGAPGTSNGQAQLLRSTHFVRSRMAPRIMPQTGSSSSSVLLGSGGMETDAEPQI